MSYNLNELFLIRSKFDSMDIADYESHYFHYKVNRLVSALLNAGLVISGQKVPHPIDKYSTIFRFYVVYLLTFCFDNTTVSRVR